VNNVKLDLNNLQVVNRVVTEQFLKKKKIKNPKKVKPLNARTAKKMTIETVEEKNRIVARNIKKHYKKRIPVFKSFSKLYVYITNNGVLSKDGSLILNGRVFKNGDKISGGWILKNTIYENGVIVVGKKNSDYHIVTKR
jgi:predicted small secreted protein